MCPNTPSTDVKCSLTISCDVQLGQPDMFHDVAVVGSRSRDRKASSHFALRHPLPLAVAIHLVVKPRVFTGILKLAAEQLM